MNDRLPRDHEAEKHLITCVVYWPERAEIVPLVEPQDFVDELHRAIWRLFHTQFSTTGAVDIKAVGRQLRCEPYLLERGYDASTTATANPARVSPIAAASPAAPAPTTTTS